MLPADTGSMMHEYDLEYYVVPVANGPPDCELQIFLKDQLLQCGYKRSDDFNRILCPRQQKQIFS